jgi:hypothetical protein
MASATGLESYLPYFYQLTDQLTQICQKNVELSTNCTAHRLDLFYRFPGGKLFFSLYEDGHSSLGRGKCLNAYPGPTIVINYFILEEKGLGLGSCLMEKMLNLVQELDISLIVLKAMNAKAANFWSKLCFLPLPGVSPDFPIMYLPLSIRSS